MATKRKSQADRGHTRPVELAEARRFAEARVARTPTGPPVPLDAAAAEQVLHELGVHQIELELQNEQLRNAHSALERSRDRYVDLFEHAPVGYLTLSPNGHIFEANDQAASLLGRSRDWLAKHRLTDFIAIEDRARYLVHLAELLRGAGTQTLDLRLLPSHGGTRWVSLQMALTAQGDSGRQRCRVALLDADARVRLQRDIARFAAIVAFSEDAIVSTDRHGVVTSWNDAARRLFGFESAEMLGHTLERLVPEMRRGEAESLARRVAAGESIAQFETERLARGGVPVPLSLTIFPLRGEHNVIVGTGWIGRDISERRRAELALREQLRHLDVLCRASQCLIMGGSDLAATRRELFQLVGTTVGCEFCFEFAVTEVPGEMRVEAVHGLPDRSTERWLGARVRATAIGDRADFQQPTIHDEPGGTEQPAPAWLADAGARCHAVFPLRTQGSLTGLIVFGSASRGRFGDANIGVIQTVCDQLSAMLERRRLLGELQAREQELSRADRAKDEFLAMLAHELRNPLAPIRNVVELMRRDAGSDPRRFDWCRAVIERQVMQMTHLLEDLLDVSRLTRNRIELRLEQLNLGLALERALESVRPLLDSRRHDVEVVRSPEPIPVNGDLTRLTQVFTNLLNNAAKYTDPGGSIRVEVADEGRTVAIRVRDTGCGIEPEDLRRVFDMFTQLAPLASGRGGGLGIGLSLTRRLVELHGGTIEARSEGRGRGSEFTVRLPTLRETADSERNSEDDAMTPAQGPRRRVLVVDDNVDAAQTLATMLELDGHDSRSAFGGAEALRALDDWLPDAMLVDLGMPGIDGYELCRRVRAQFGDRAPLMIASTGWGQPEDRRRSQDAGFDAHLVKPVEPERITALLAEHCGVTPESR